MAIDLHASFQFTDVEAQPDTVTAQWIVPHDLPYLQGHFPNQPIVPAVAMLDATTVLLTQAFGVSTEISEVKNAKFTKPLEPNQKVLIACKRLGAQEWTVDWRVGIDSVAKLHLAI